MYLSIGDPKTAGYDFIWLNVCIYITSLFNKQQKQTARYGSNAR